MVMVTSSVLPDATFPSSRALACGNKTEALVFRESCHVVISTNIYENTMARGLEDNIRKHAGRGT